MNALDDHLVTASPSEAHFVLDGMSCASCAVRAERALLGMPGVIAAQVNAAVHTADVTFAPPATPGAMATVLAAAGYPPREGQVVLRVEGMTCASCTGRVERVLKAQPGVADAAVNLTTREAHVRIWEGAVEAGALAAAVTRAGYAAAPDEVSDGPGHVHEHDESAGLARLAAIAAVLSVPLVVLEMGGYMIPAFHHAMVGWVGQPGLWIVQMLLAAAVLAGPGLNILRSGFKALLRGAPEMNSLVAIGTTAAFGYSAIVTLAPGMLPPEARAVYFEAAAVIVTLVLTGRWLEGRARGQAGSAIAALMALAPPSVQVKGGERLGRATFGCRAAGDAVAGSAR
jgi:Cu+-exporting ATPase